MTAVNGLRVTSTDPASRCWEPAGPICSGWRRAGLVQVEDQRPARLSVFGTFFNAGAGVKARQLADPGPPAGF